MTPRRKRVLTGFAEGGVVISCLCAMAFSSWFGVGAGASGLALMAILLRSRQELCNKCGWVRAIRGR